MRTVKARQAIYCSPFLINCYGKGNSTIFLHLRIKSSQLILSLDIVINSKEEYGAHIVLIDHCADIKSVVWTLELYYHHLAKFLIERHVLYDGVDVLLRRYLLCRLCRCSRCQVMVELVRHILQEIQIAASGRTAQYIGPALCANKLASTHRGSIDNHNKKKRGQ